MKRYLNAKVFDFDQVKGISKNQLLQHYTLYEGYVQKINQIWDELENEENYKDESATYSKIRSLKLGESFALNGVKLHELYFENLGGKNTKPYGQILELINRKYGSYELFKEKFKSIGLAVRGWVVLAIQLNNLYMFGSDAHDVGAIWSAYPLLVMDVYEHAYMIDFGVNRKQYIDEFFKNINWKIVNERLHSYNNLFNIKKTNDKLYNNNFKYYLY
ncbi:superoxide dismutase, Fe-Mn family [Alkalithermobacter thermoalcaliphilus JW-YL-7 = DSM 7308]|uniref:superoxide dismutase n=1 Tax=Alkalithermobacter thermoalcaliphilus JW-YL-7 = DSM 7308 TaxID=1121328 RepID=A0A150FPA4_CLOPD|nr:Manganese/iron superoxide dismutase [[Clostridium] paradoxum JW-YL-7 = DSM 7308]SHK52529.1 superoxide dismutase, Fe-Mn family [[Clostridium] paradoxum JW-YL-7 = DSM 7308]